MMDSAAPVGHGQTAMAFVIAQRECQVVGHQGPEAGGADLRVIVVWAKGPCAIVFENRGVTSATGSFEDTWCPKKVNQALVAPKNKIRARRRVRPYTRGFVGAPARTRRGGVREGSPAAGGSEFFVTRFVTQPGSDAEGDLRSARETEEREGR